MNSSLVGNPELLEMLNRGKEQMAETQMLSEKFQGEFLAKIPDSVRPFFDLNSFRIEVKEYGGLSIKGYLENGMIEIWARDILFKETFKKNLVLSSLPVTYSACYRLSSNGVFSTSVTESSLERTLFVVHQKYQKELQLSKQKEERMVLETAS